MHKYEMRVANVYQSYDNYNYNCMAIDTRNTCYFLSHVIMKESSE